MSADRLTAAVKLAIALVLTVGLARGLGASLKAAADPLNASLTTPRS